MPPTHPPPLSMADYIGPIVGAAVFVFLMGLVKEPARRKINAVIVAGATGAYISGGPIMPTSSFGCLIFDCLIAIWFLMGAPPALSAIQESE